MSDKILVKGLYAKQGKFGMKISVKVDDLVQFLNTHKNEKGYVNIDQNNVKEPKEGKSPFYFTLDTWQPSEGITNNYKPTASTTPIKEGTKFVVEEKEKLLIQTDDSDDLPF